MILLDGKKISEEIQLSLKDRINSLVEQKHTPGLGVILVGKREDSIKYVNAKRKVCEKLGIYFFLKEFNENVSENELINEIEKMNNHSEIHGILVQLPLPMNLNKEKIVNTISVNKDVDGFHVMNAGKLFLNHEKKQFVPCTPLGCMELIDAYRIDVEGLNITVIGASDIVGLPLSMMLLQRGATVTICHIRTKDVKQHTKTADLVVSCCGFPHLVKNDWLKESVIVIDIGMNMLDGKLVGDVDFLEVKEKCQYITPVPGGVGPMTIAMLVKQLVESTERFSQL
jgi:methylenetetrahydrofolate dehydrogenase (NADP+)/methenyltetrahydrofolate cyclohydrolase